MNGLFHLAFAAGVICASTALAGERMEINNTYPLNEELFLLSDRAFYTQDNHGYYEVIEGPFRDGPARCIGSGFVSRNGENTIEGICIFGEGDDTFTMAWKAGEQGAANDWTIVAGSGRYKGMTGDGIATTNPEFMYRALPQRLTHIIGVVEIPEN